MLITSENDLKNAIVYQKLWEKEVMDQNYGCFICIFRRFWVKNVVSRGNLSHWSSELVFMFLESGKHVEWGQLAS